MSGAPTARTAAPFVTAGQFTLGHGANPAFSTIYLQEPTDLETQFVDRFDEIRAAIRAKGGDASAEDVHNAFFDLNDNLLTSLVERARDPQWVGDNLHRYGLQPGQQIAYNIDFLRNRHHAVYLGAGLIAEVASPECPSRVTRKTLADKCVGLSTLAWFVRDGIRMKLHDKDAQINFYRVRHAGKKFNARATIERAQSYLRKTHGKFTYNYLRNNCEHGACFIATGEARSDQLRRFNPLLTQSSQYVHMAVALKFNEANTKAKRLCRQLGIKTQEAYSKWCASKGDNDYGMPDHPDIVYHERGWKSWDAWLGTDWYDF